MVWFIDGILICPKSLCVLKVQGIDYYDLYTTACQTVNLPNEENVRERFRSKPIDISKNHPDHCITILQMTGEAIEAIDA